MKGECPYDIRELVQKNTHFQCQLCSKQILRAGKYNWKSRSLVADYKSTSFECCRDCIYREAFGSKYKGAAMRGKVIEING